MLATIQSRSLCLLRCVKTLKIRIYRSIILPLVLYGCETWSLTLREEHRLRMSRRIFGLKRDDVMGSWRELHNEALCHLQSSPSIFRMIKSRRMRWAGHVAQIARRGMHTGYWWES
jgi:hypothetical protein